MTDAGQAPAPADTAGQAAAPTNDQGNLPLGGDIVSPTQPAATAPPWFGEVDEATQLFVTGKGWKDPAGVIKSYQNLEKLHGGSNEVLERPIDPGNKEAWDKFYNKLGRPESSDKYDLKAAENANTDFMDWYKSNAHELGLTQNQAANLMEKYNEFESGLIDNQLKDANLQNDADISDLKKELGVGFDKQTALARRALESLGLNKEDIGFMEEKIGIKITFKIAQELSKRMGEDEFIDGGKSANSGFGGMTPEQAKSERARLLMDPNFKNAYFKDKGPAHDDAVKKIAQLSSYEVGQEPV